jgi:hypothetical protein
MPTVNQALSNGKQERLKIVQQQAIGKLLQDSCGIVADKLFQKEKFVDRNFDLGYDETEGSTCKFVNTYYYCNLQANIDVCTRWKEARKWILTYISRSLRNNKSTAMEWAFLGTYSLVYTVLSESKRG